MKLIFDGDCAFCTTCSLFGKKRLRQANAVSIIAWQNIADLSEYGLTQEQVTKRVYFVDSKGRAFGGAQALGKFAKQMVFPWSIFGAVLSIKFFALLAEPIYRLVARNRHRMPGATDACKLDLGESKVDPLKRGILGLRLFSRSGILNKLARQHQHFERQPLSYEEVGATRGERPESYRYDTYSLVIGRGKKDFDKAVAGFQSWKSHNGAGLFAFPEQMDFSLGKTVSFGFVIGPLVIYIPDRIVYVEQTDSKYECVYGSVAGHPEQGEELFRIVMNDDEVVLMEVECFSRIVATGARIFYPVSRFLQKRVTKKYMSSLRNYIQGTTS